VRSFWMIWIRISNPRSLGSWCIKGADESVTRVDSSVPLMQHDPSDLGSLILIQIRSKERTLIVWKKHNVYNYHE